MSGIVGIFNLDGRPVSRDVLARMARQLAARAPDGGDVWVDGAVGLGYAYLNLMRDKTHQRQPLAPDERAWIVADARLDNRAALAATLGVEGSDAALILAAYRQYGERFVEHLEGDFAFAIWDESSGKLICVRDPLGVRPFYFIQLDDIFLFSSDIEALKQHPRFRPGLDEAFIADFLYFGDSQDPQATVFRHVRRLPAANLMVVTRQSVRTHAYWSIEQVPAVRYRDEREYLDNFNELFAQAIARRIHGADVSILLSGGMDSGGVAAVAAVLKRTEPGAISGYSLSSAGLLPEDHEDRFTRQTANHLGIAVDFQQLDDYRLFARRDYQQAYPSEPVPNPDLAVTFDRLQQLQARSIRTVLTGEGGDAVFAGSVAPLHNDIRNGAWLKVVRDVFQHVRKTHSMRGLGLRSLLRGRSRQVWQPVHPGWLNPDFARRTGSQDRWARYWLGASASHDDRAQIGSLSRGRFFSLYEALRLPYAVQHPFLDVRLLTFLLGIPVHQKQDKGLLRQAMEGRLPERIVRRPKIALVGDVIQARITRGDLTWVSSSAMRERLEPYVDCARYFSEIDSIRKSGNQGSTWNSWIMIHPLALADWLSHRYLDGDAD